MAPDTLSLALKVAIVTGSGRENGIGAGIALALARNGARVAINFVSDASAPRAATVAASIEAATGQKPAVVQADVATPEGAAKLVSETLKAFGTDTIDILVNNAGSGSGHGKTLLELSPEDIHAGYAANLYTTFFVTQAAVPHMPRGGRVVNVGTVISRVSLPGVSVYGSSKAAQDYLTLAWALELGRSRGITVNTVAPGPTGGTDAGGWLPAGSVRDVIAKRLTEATVAEERAGTVEDVADAVLLIASEKSRWITGQYVAAGGGIAW